MTTLKQRALEVLILAVGLVTIYYIGVSHGLNQASKTQAKAQQVAVQAAQDEAAKTQAKAVAIAYKNGIDSVQPIVEYRDRVQTLEAKTKVITKEVPVYVDSCTGQPGHLPDALRVRLNTAIDAANAAAQRAGDSAGMPAATGAARSSASDILARNGRSRAHRQRGEGGQDGRAAGGMRGVDQQGPAGASAPA